MQWWEEQNSEAEYATHFQAPKHTHLRLKAMTSYCPFEKVSNTKCLTVLPAFYIFASTEFWRKC